MNVVMLRGRLSRPAEVRILQSGTRLVAIDVTVARPGEKAESVPVAWLDAPDWAAKLEAGDEIVALGRVRRRFFRAGGSTASRTEVVASGMAPARHGKRVAALVEQALAALAQR